MIGWEYLCWAVTVAIFVFGATSLPGQLLPQPARETVALWLTESEEHRWAKAFGALFDRLMGPKHFSLKRLGRSAIGTGLAVVLLYLLFGPVLGLMDSRADSVITTGELLVFGLLINLAADYLSLIETRWLLARFENVRGFFGQLALLALDFVLSAGIILVAITLFRLARGEAMLSPVEMLAGYTPFAIFFYSTFLTSVWAWAFCASAWFIRLFTRLGLARVLDVYKRPFAQIGFVSGALVLAALLAGKPAADWAVKQDFDGWLCDAFGGRICTHAARVAPDDKLAFDRVSRACQTGDASVCRDVLDGLSERQSAEAAPYWRAACNDGDWDACNSLGFMYDEALGVAQDYDRARTLYDRACEGGNMSGCSNLGFMYRNALGVAQDYDRARTLYDRACEGGHMSGCYNLGALYENAIGVAQDYDRARTLYKCACEGENMSGCSNLGALY